MSISIGQIELKNNVFLAPMSGVTDEAFRCISHDAGAGLVVSEMVASEELVRERPDMVRRAKGHRKVKPFVIQLAGREAHWMAEGARAAQDLGADMIDINMGCPARQVTGGLSGSALMRNLDHALTLIEATVGASEVPVTLKMRLGWDDGSINAPQLARRAENAGIKLITVHGRTRCQFYTGKADWPAIRAVKDAITIPLIANGDCQSPDDAKKMLNASGADGVMIGRAAYGRPWFPGHVAAALHGGSAAFSLSDEKDLVLRHHQMTIDLYGESLGNKTFRKHLSWTIDRLGKRNLITPEVASHYRKRYLTELQNPLVKAGIHDLYDRVMDAHGAVAA